MQTVLHLNNWILPKPKPEPKVKEVFNLIFQKAYTRSTTYISYQSTSKSVGESRKIKTTLSILGNVFVPDSYPGRVSVFFNHLKEVWIFLEFKVENEITASFPEVKIVLAACQLQVQVLSEVLQMYPTKIFS